MSQNQINRRAFLKYSALGAFGFVASTGLGLLPGTAGKFFQGIIPEAKAAADHTLIYVFCRGGMDALSLFPPVEPKLKAAYMAKRPNIKFNALPIVNPHGVVEAFGVNDQIPELNELLVDRDMLVVYGAGSMNNTTSHFDQMNYIESGSSVKKIGEGFFQRVAQAGSFTNKTDLIAIENVIPRSLKGMGFVFQYRSPMELVALGGAGIVPGVIKTNRLKNNYVNIGKIHRTASDYADSSVEVYGKVNPVALAAAPIKDIAEAARLVVAGVAPKVMTVTVNGWDFHDDLQNRLLSGTGADLAKSLKSLRDTLKASGKWESTTVVVMSEFGRRMAENGSLGCDHGRGGAIMVLGGLLHGGGSVAMKNDLPNRMLDLYDSTKNNVTQSNLPVDFDYRSILAEVFQKRFGINMLDSNSKLIHPIFNSEEVVGGMTNILRLSKAA